MAKSNIVNEINTLEAVQLLCEVYADVASLRMKQTRERVLRARDYITKLEEIFEEVRSSYFKQIKRLAKSKKKDGGLTLLSHNGKSVAVFLSSNEPLYGSIITNTFRLFMDAVASDDVEITIVGRQGLSLFLSESLGRAYTYFDLPDYGAAQDFIEDIIKHIVQYDAINLFYGKYISVINQKPAKQTITAETVITSHNEEPIVYYFEPNLEAVMVFFETELFASLFEQSVSESRLAKYASRLVAMDQAKESIRQRKIKLNILRLREQHIRTNRKQLNRLSTILYYG